MSYRPQFPIPTPEGFEDVEFIHYFDSTNSPGLGTALTAGQQLMGIPLLLEPDTEYIIRGIQVAIEAEDSIGLRFRTPNGEYLSDDYVPAGAYSGQSAAPVGACPVPVECEIVCPPGGIILVDVKNLR